MVLTSEEQVYLNTLAENGETVKVLLNPGLKPYSYFEEHVAKGIMVDLMQNMAYKCKIPYEFIETENTAHIMRQLIAKRQTLFLPVN